MKSWTLLQHRGRPSSLPLPERSLLSGKGSFGYIRRLSERSLVRKISSNLMEHSERNQDDSSWHTDDLCTSTNSNSHHNHCCQYHHSSSCSLIEGTQPQPQHAQDPSSSSSPGQGDDDCHNSVLETVSLPANWTSSTAGSTSTTGATAAVASITGAICTCTPDNVLSVAAPPVPLHRKELQIGELVGQGSFSQVYAVTSLTFKDELVPNDHPRTFALLYGRQRLRQLFNDNIASKTSTTESTAEDDDRSFSSLSLSLSLSSKRKKTPKKIQKKKKKKKKKSSKKEQQQPQQDAPSVTGTSGCQTGECLPEAPPLLVVKHLNRKLLRRPPDFFYAALQLEREAQILSSLQHPHIVRLRGVALCGTAALRSGRYNEFFIVMDRLTDSLEDRIHKSRKQAFVPGLQTCLEYAIQLASALEYLHERRLVFRDVKPVNVGFQGSPTSTAGANTPASYSERLQLFDFGFCRSLPQQCFHDRHADMESFHMSLAGTIRYMAPEVMQHQAYNCKADTYSFALTLYEMLALEKPYTMIRANHFQEYICAHHVRPNLEDLHNYLPIVPNALIGILLQSWCVSVQDRWTMTQVKNALVALRQEIMSTSSSSSSSSTTIRAFTGKCATTKSCSMTSAAAAASTVAFRHASPLVPRLEVAEVLPVAPPATCHRRRH